MRRRHSNCIPILLSGLLALAPTPVLALCDVNVVTFEGTASFPVPIAGIDLDDLAVTVRASAQSTGDQCSIDPGSITVDVPDGITGAFSVSAELTLRQGSPNCMGGQDPDGSCIVTLEVSGTDGSSATARGTRTLLVSEAQIEAAATIGGQDVEVRASKAIAGLPLSSECFKWAKRHLRKRAVCNFKLLKLGPTAAAKCKDGCAASSTNQTAPCEPVGCDDGDFVQAVLAMSHGSNDQQVDAMSATGVSDFTDPAIKNGVICQKKIGKSAINYLALRSKLVQKLCVETSSDSAACRETQGDDAAVKFNPIDSAPCVAGQTVDGGTGKILPDVLDPCSTACIAGGAIDRKCLKNCLRQVIDDYSDGLVGEIGVCGNGILQPSAGEFCDDGNLGSGDGCSSTCTIEP